MELNRRDFLKVLRDIGVVSVLPKIPKREEPPKEETEEVVNDAFERLAHSCTGSLSSTSGPPCPFHWPDEAETKKMRESQHPWTWGP